jgi:hypothetical protein
MYPNGLFWSKFGTLIANAFGLGPLNIKKIEPSKEGDIIIELALETLPKTSTSTAVSSFVAMPLIF